MSYLQTEFPLFSDPQFERLKTVLLRLGKPDRVPYYELFVNREVMEVILGKTIVDCRDTVEFYHRLGYDYVPAWPHRELKVGSLVDRSLGYPISDWDTFNSYEWPPTDSIDFSEFDMVKPLLPKGMKIIGETGGILENIEALVGYEQLCYMLADQPDLVEAILARVGELYEAMYAGMSCREEVGAVVISDDLGFKTQTLISPNELRRHILPRHRKLAEIIHESGKPCILHSCGRLEEIMEDIIEDVGIDAKHSYEDQILPVERAMDLYGDRIAILGGFDVDKLTRFSEDEVRSYTNTLLEALSGGGGYALGSGNSIPGFIPVANYLAMLGEGYRYARAG